MVKFVELTFEERDCVAQVATVAIGYHPKSSTLYSPRSVVVPCVI